MPRVVPHSPYRERQSPTGPISRHKTSTCVKEEQGTVVVGGRWSDNLVMAIDNLFIEGCSVSVHRICFTRL